MELEKKVHNLEQNLIQLKSSQLIGSSNARAIEVWNFSESGTTTTERCYVLVFQASSTIHPLVRANATVTIGGEMAHDWYENGSFVGGKMCYITYDQTRILGDLYFNNIISQNIFDEYTTAAMFYLSNWATSNAWNYNIEGSLYATGEGKVTVYSFEV